MNILLFLASVFILISLPFVILLIILKRLKIDYRIRGFMHIADLHFEIEYKFIKIKIYIESIQCKLIWLRLRFHFSGIKSSIEIKDKYPGHRHSYMTPLSLIKKKSSIFKNTFINEKIDNESLSKTKKKFFRIINEKLFRKHLLTKEKFPEIYSVDNIKTKKNISLYEYLIRIFLRTCDCLIEECNFIINVVGNDFSYGFYCRKILFGVVKGATKNRGLLLITTIYDFKVNEYREFDSDSNDKLYMINILNLDTLFLHFKLENGIFTDPDIFLTLINTISIMIDVYRLNINISALMLTNIFAMVAQIIRIASSQNDIKNPYNRLSISENILRIKCIEEYILEKVQSQINKIKFRITNLEINVYSDDFVFKFLKLKSNYFTIVIKNRLNDYFDKTSIKLLTSTVDIKIQELEIFTGNNVRITQYPIVSLYFQDGIIYNYLLMDAEITSIMNMDVSNIEISISTKQLNKIIELALSIVNGIDQIEELEFNNRERVIYEPYKDSKVLNFSFSLGINLFSDTLITEIDKLNLDIKIEKNRFKGNTIIIHTSPIILSIANTNYLTYFLENKNFFFASNIFVKGFKLEINETINDINIRYFSENSKSTNFDKHSDIKISFDYINCICYDNHLNDIIKFISEFLTYIFKSNINKNNQKVLSNYIKEERVEIYFNKIDVLKYIDFTDVIIGKIKDFKLIVDDLLEMPRVIFFHQCLTDVPLLPKTKVIEMKNFIIKFSENDVDILFYDININFYNIKFSYPVAKISIYYQFFPQWIDYYFIYQFMLHEDCREMNIVESAKRSKVCIRFENLLALINDTTISSSSILFANSNDLENLKSNDIVKYLKSVKNNIFTLKVTNFTISIEDFYERKIESHNVFNFDMNSYINLTQKKCNLNLTFQEIDIKHENYNFINIKNFQILIKDQYRLTNYDINKLDYYISIYKYHTLFFQRIKCEKYIKSNVQLILKNLVINLEDLKIFDKTNHFIIKAIKTIINFPFKEYLLSEYSTLNLNKYDYVTEISIYNLEGRLNLIDPVTNNIYNQLNLKLDFLVLTMNKRMKVDLMEITINYFSFGFDPSQKSGFPLIIIPLAEVNFDNFNNRIRINIPSHTDSLKKRDSTEVEYSKLFSDIYKSELHLFIMQTKSLTLFLNFKYLSVFTKIFETILERSRYLKYLIFSNPNNRYDYKSKTIKKKLTDIKDYPGKVRRNSVSVSQQKIMLCLYDLKIIYLLEYKNEYSAIFKFNPDIVEKGYFGYIIRLYSFSFKYILQGEFVDNLKFRTNLFTVSVLSDDNFNDSKFFSQDREIYLGKFTNMKSLDAYNEFMELDENNKYKFINRNILEHFDYITINNDKHKINKNIFNDLIFDYKHTIIKISDINFSRQSNRNENIENISITVENFKITWSKFNKDVLQLLLFDDVLLIVDKIILKVDTKKENKEKISIVDLGRFNFVFQLINPQICIQNEIKKSTLLLTTKKSCKVIISKVCMNESSKDFKLEFYLKMMALYRAPTYMDSNNIYWIGQSDENKYYLEEGLFKQILETPEINFLIYQVVKSKNEDEFDCFTKVAIEVDKIRGDFESSYFSDFMNIIEVFIFDRGYSFAEQKENIDSRKKDLECFSTEELENLIKNKLSIISALQSMTAQKQIEFSLSEVILQLLKGGKPVIKLLMINFEGQHSIYLDKSSDTKINVRNLKIFNLENDKNINETLLSPYDITKVGDHEDKMNLLTFRKRDRYLSIDTDSNWYIIDLFELVVLPLRLCVSKSQIEFIIAFFFYDPNENEIKHEEYRNLLLSSSKFIEKKTKKDDSNEAKMEKKRNEEVESYPIYFNSFKLNETEILLSFQFSENSSLNLKNARVKFSSFVKNEKFYPLKILLERLFSHCKMQCFKNVSNLISSFFGSDDEPKRRNDNEDGFRKMLFGNK